MDKTQLILKLIKERSAEELEKLFDEEEKRDLSECNYDRKDLNEKYYIYTDIGPTFVFTDKEKFNKKLTSIFNKRLDGVCIEPSYHNKDGEQMIIQYNQQNIKDRLTMINYIIDTYKINAENADGAAIQLFNKKEEITYQIWYENDVIKNRQDIEQYWTDIHRNKFAKDCLNLLEDNKRLDIQQAINTICFYDTSELNRETAKHNIEKYLLNSQNDQLKHFGEQLFELLNMQIHYNFDPRYIPNEE